jgi:catechol 2,3-dioxygenase-like lactoylglutathione lyase family enzyme
MAVLRINHVQVAMPRDREDEARRFYGELLGLREIPKPPALATRGGVWFELGNAELHLGVDADFRPAKKAHVAFEVEDIDRIAARCRDAGYVPRPDDQIQGQRRFFVEDPFGNRLEVMEVRR